jgi:two-component system, NarL family, nitrate/nitrite response regulator NarL
MTGDDQGVMANVAAGQGPPDRPVRVVLADDECLFRASLRHLLSVPPSVIKDVYGVDVGPGFQVVGEAGSGEETIRVVRSAQPALLLLDLSMPRLTGLEALREIAPVRESLRAIMLAGWFERDDLVTAVQLGARGLLLKTTTTEVLFEAMMSVLAGGYWIGQKLLTDLLETMRPLIQSSREGPSPSPWKLTARERQVLGMVAAAHCNKAIARRFNVSEETVKHHLTRLFAKIGASSRLELAMLATRHGIVEPVEPDTDETSAALPAESRSPALLDAPSKKEASHPGGLVSPPTVP